MTAKLPDRLICLESDVSSALPTLEVLSVGHFLRKYSRVDHTFEVHAVGLVLKGSGSFRWKESAPSQRLEAPFYFYVEPGVPMRYGPEPGGWWEERYITFGGARVREWKDLGWLPAAPRAYGLPSPEESAQSHQQIIDNLKTRDPDHVAEAKLEIEQLILRLHLATRRAEATFDGEKHLKNLTRSWQRSPEQPIDLKRAAASMGLSYSRFRQLFRAKFRVSPYQYILQLRIQAAQHWLRSSPYRVKEIAGRTGFQSMESFDRAFRKMVGASPTQFRRRHRSLFSI